MAMALAAESIPSGLGWLAMVSAPRRCSTLRGALKHDLGCDFWLHNLQF